MVVVIDNITLLRLENGGLDDVKNILKNFIEKHKQATAFPELNVDDRRKKLWTLLFSHLDKPSSACCHRECLACVRILSREKLDLEDLCCEKWMNILLYHAGLVPQEQILLMTNHTFDNAEVVLEALKCLCNILYNCESALHLCAHNHAAEAIMTRLRTYHENLLPHDIKFFDMRMLFVLTALQPSVRPRLKEELHGLTYLMEILDMTIKESSNLEGRAPNSPPILSENQTQLSCEVLKVLYNLLCRPVGGTGPGAAEDEEEEDGQLIRLEALLRELVLADTEPATLADQLQSNVVNLLTTQPARCHRELAAPLTKDVPKEAEFDGYNMEALAVLVRFLDCRLNQNPGVQTLQERLSPIVTVLHDCAAGDRLLRRYLRYRILPPLRDVHTRPEEGTTLRNKLCRLLTSPVTCVQVVVAELLFVLCKESVSRMIKYTGYGNAAGQFANRGLLGCQSNAGQYSSDSDSETDEYAMYKHGINPVVGCYMPPRPDPTANMTEEQKEYEALKLVNMMDQLQRQGVINPCRIGEDGRPQPVNHILELQEELPKQLGNARNDGEK